MDAAHISSPRRTSTRSDETPKYMSRLRAIWELSRQETSSKRINGLFKLLGEEDLWVAAYKKLAPNPGSMTAGGASGTIDRTSVKSLRALRDSVCEGRFEFVTTSRQLRLRQGRGRTGDVRCKQLKPISLGPLGIGQFQDRLVQEVIRTLLFFIYEPVFCENSHGFRTGRSQHTCLKYVRQHFRGVNWIIEGDISKCFDTLPHATVMKLLSKKIQDHRFLNLVRKGLQANILLPDDKRQKSLVGTPQGSIVSPLLSNIVLHELDRFVNRLKRIVDRGVKRRQNPAYARLMTRFIRASCPQERIKLKKEAIASGYRNLLDPNFLRLSYARYADDFIVGILGPKKLAARIKRLIGVFLKNRLGLTLNLEKTTITRTLRNSVPFLGYLINYGPMNTFPITSSYQGQWRTIKGPWKAGTLRLLVDMKKIIESLNNKGFCNKKGDPLPNFRFFQDPQSHTVSRASAILRGIANYYHLADNKVRSVQRISFIVLHSLAKMFAAKYKLRTRAQVFKKAGRNLSKPLTGRFRTAAAAGAVGSPYWGSPPYKGSLPSWPEPEVSPKRVDLRHLKRRVGLQVRRSNLKGKVGSPLGDQQLSQWAIDAGAPSTCLSCWASHTHARRSYHGRTENFWPKVGSLAKGQLRVNSRIPFAAFNLDRRVRKVSHPVLQSTCARSSSNEKVEMHQVRGLKDLKGPNRRRSNR